MIRIKKILLVMTLLPVMAITGCNSSEKAIRLTTNSFLEAYFKVDYLKAGTFCTEELAEKLANSLKNFDSIEPSVKEMLQKHSSEVKTEIVSVDRSRCRDSAAVLYKVILPNFQDGIKNTLLFARVNKEWKIISLGN